MGLQTRQELAILSRYKVNTEIRKYVGEEANDD